MLLQWKLYFMDSWTANKQWIHGQQTVDSWTAMSQQLSAGNGVFQFRSLCIPAELPALTFPCQMLHFRLLRWFEGVCEPFWTRSTPYYFLGGDTCSMNLHWPPIFKTSASFFTCILPRLFTTSFSFLDGRSAVTARTSTACCPERGTSVFEVEVCTAYTQPSVEKPLPLPRSKVNTTRTVALHKLISSNVEKQAFPFFLKLESVLLSSSVV